MTERPLAADPFTTTNGYTLPRPPRFSPAPPAIFRAGTLGAIIRMRSSVRGRDALFDIAAAGPLAGLAVALPAALLGLVWSTIVPAPPGPHLVFGESVLTRALVWLRFGTLPDGMVVSTHPMADAAWFGFLVTALNLLRSEEHTSELQSRLHLVCRL